MIDSVDVLAAQTVARMFVEYEPRDRLTALDFAASVKDRIETARTLCTLQLTLRGVKPVEEGEAYKHKGKEYKVLGISQHYSTHAESETYTELLLARV